MRAVAQAADGATMLKQRTLALWVAQNRLAAAQLEPTWPAPGRRDGDARQAGSALRLARNGHRNAQPGVPQDRDRRRRSRGAGLRARPSCGLSRAAAAAMKRHRAGFTLIELLIALGDPRSRRGARLPRARRTHRERGEARCGSRPLASPRRALRAARGRRARARSRATFGPAPATEAAWVGDVDAAGDADPAFLARGAGVRGRTGERRTTHRLPSAQRRRRGALLAVPRSAIDSGARSLRADRRRRARSASPISTRAAPGANAGRRWASPPCRARSGSS